MIIVCTKKKVFRYTCQKWKSDHKNCKEKDHANVTNSWFYGNKSKGFKEDSISKW